MATTEEQVCKNVGMGQIALLNNGETARSVLGSCVGLLLFSCVSKRSILAHIVLSQDKSGRGPAGKFADTALPAMLDQLAKSGTKTNSLIAKMVGGAAMFNPGGKMEIGKSNCEAVRRLLREHSIRLAAEDIGGSVGRKIFVDGSTGKISIEQAGQPMMEI